MINTRALCLFAQTASVLSLASAAHAGGSPDKSPTQVIQPKEESPFDKLWGLATLYKNDQNPYLEELNFTGRFQGQYYAIDGENASSDDWDYRRFRLGLKAKMFDKHLEFNGEMFSELNSGGDFYAGLKNFNLTYKFSDAFSVKVGKMEPKFSYDYSISDTQLIIFERNALINQFKNDYGTGISFDGKVDNWSYSLTGLSNEVDKEFGSFAGGYSLFATVGYDLKGTLGFEKAQWRLDYMHSEHDTKDTLLTGFDNGLATSLELKQGPYGLISEVIAGFGNSNSVGLILTPTYDITKKLQLVGRYQLANSDDAKGLSPQSRYEGRNGAPKGDLYNAAYLGFNYYLYGQKLKLMSGVEYANMSGGDSSWTWLGGIRMYW